MFRHCQISCLCVSMCLIVLNLVLLSECARYMVWPLYVSTSVYCFVCFYFGFSSLWNQITTIKQFIYILRRLLMYIQLNSHINKTQTHKSKFILDQNVCLIIIWYKCFQLLLETTKCSQMFGERSQAHSFNAANYTTELNSTQLERKKSKCLSSQINGWKSRWRLIELSLRTLTWRW